MLTIHSGDLGDTAVLHCSERIVRGMEAVLCAAVTSQSEKQTIVLDLGDVTAVDAAGLGVFALLGWWAGAQQIELFLSNPNRHVRRLLDVTKLDTVLRVCSSEEVGGCGSLRGVGCSVMPESNVGRSKGARTTWEPRELPLLIVHRSVALSPP